MSKLKPLGKFKTITLSNVSHMNFCKDEYSHEELSYLRHEFRSIIRPSSLDGKMVSDNQAKILDRIAKEYQVSLTLTRRLRSRVLTDQRSETL